MSTTVYDEPPRRQPVLETTTTTMSGGQHIHRRISWAAIIGGVVLVVTAQLLWSLLGAGIGLDTVNANAGTTPSAGSLGISAGVWWIISSVVALAFGGFAAGWMAGIETRWDGVLHGLITWGIATLLTVYLLSSAIGGIVGGGASAPGRPRLGRRQRHQGTRRSPWPKPPASAPTCCSSRRRPTSSPPTPTRRP